MIVIAALTVLSLVISIPLWKVARSENRLTWASAVALATWLVVIAILLIAEIPSRMLNWFDAEHSNLAERYAILKPLLGGEQYLIVRDVIVNTVQGIFFVAIVLAAYLWGQRQRKTGRFKSS